jgi:hypothetical protein
MPTSDLGLSTTPSNIPPPLLFSLLSYMRTTLWIHLDTYLPKSTSLSPAKPPQYKLENGFITKDQYPLPLQLLWKGLLQVILITPLPLNYRDINSGYMFLL